MPFLPTLFYGFSVEFVLKFFDPLHIGHGHEGGGLFAPAADDDPLPASGPVQQFREFALGFSIVNSVMTDTPYLYYQCIRRPIAVKGYQGGKSRLGKVYRT